MKLIKYKREGSKTNFYYMAWKAVKKHESLISGRNTGKHKRNTIIFESRNPLNQLLYERSVGKMWVFEDKFLVVTEIRMIHHLFLCK